MTPYLLPKAYGEAEFTERKSRFIGRCAPVSSEREALDFIRDIRARHRDAAHNVYAYRLRDGNLCRHSDDGEPSGTAGLPLLEVFSRRDVYDFVCVGTRYFGGVLLGAGGLVRAYAHTGVIALEASGLAAMRAWRRGRVALAYSLYEQTLRLLGEQGAIRIETHFAEIVTACFHIAAESWENLCGALTETTNGSVVPEDLGTEWFPG